MNPLPLSSLISSSNYFLIFIAMIIEGPLVTYIAAFGASFGIFNVYYVFFLSLLGNLIADIIYFSVGRFGNKAFLYKYTSKLRNKSFKKLIYHIEDNTGKSLAIIKAIFPLAAPGIVVMGMSKLSFKKFIFFAFIFGIPISLLFTTVGFYSGITVNAFAEYLKIGEITIIISFLLFFLVWFLYKKISSQLTKNMENIL